ncbi:MAG: membrane protein insertase YidC [Muribaculaceae bacterium]|nr:membrane protein insertase YidC [Muribaculaceae bacterium]
MWLNQPSEEELARQRQAQAELAAAQQNAIEQAQQNELLVDSFTPTELALVAPTVKQYGTLVDGVYKLENKNVNLSLEGDKLSGTVTAGDTLININDVLTANWANCKPRVASLAVKVLKSELNNIARYKEFAQYLTGEEKTVKLENSVLSLDLSSKGGFLSRAELKEYQAYDSSNIVLFDPATSDFNMTLLTNNQRLETRDLYFTPEVESDTTVVMALNLGQNARFAIRYTLLPDSYIVKMDIEQSNMTDIIPSSTSEIDIHWYQKMKRNESGRTFEERNSAIYYKYAGGDVEDLNALETESEEADSRVKWVAFKNQFFSSVIIARDNFTGAKFNSVDLKETSQTAFLKDMTADMAIEYSSANANPASFDIFLGPNLYPLLSDYDDELNADEDLELTKLIPLGWALFRWINTLIIIPVFTFLGSFMSNYGIIILLLTIFIKLLLFPFTYKSYMSQAKMRLLAPEIKEINDKYPGQENAMVRQQKTMELYSKAGASPFSGCLPMLLQMPILIAMFTFFPSCIELRGEAFLWAKDLSAPDAIFSWETHIPIISSIFGNHVSLFCLLMTVTNILYTYINMQNQPQQSSMPGMKWMMYLMPVMFLFFFNDYASGLSYYYFLSLLITIVQTYAFRFIIDEDKVKAQMKANAKKPRKKSGFMARLEEAQRQQQAMLREQQKQQAKKGKH